MTPNNNQLEIRRENQILKFRLRAAKTQIKNLKHVVKRSQIPELDETEIELLANIADSDINDAFEVTFAENLRLSKPQLDFHLTKLIKAGCIDILFVDPSFGENFVITQRGREALFKKNLL
jgi:hypothetical protein